MMLSAEATAIRANNWTRGSIIKSDGSGSFVTRENVPLPEGDYMLISQVCDISTPPLDDEPYVEVIKLNPIVEINGSFTKAKSHKKLHIEISSGKYIELKAMERFIITRESLTKKVPDAHCTMEIADAVVSWVTKKMTRSPFPDNFRRRIDRDEMKKILKKTHDSITHFMVQLDTNEELPDNVPYKVSILLIVQSEALDEDMEKVRDTLRKIVDLMTLDPGIHIISDDVERKGLITLDKFDNYKEFYFDDLSWDSKPRKKVEVE